MPAVELECHPPNVFCSVCRVLEEAELWCCGDCGSDKYFCATCALGQFIPCVPVGLRWEWRRQDDHDCHSQYNRLLIVVDVRGRAHDVWLQFCSCELEPVTLIRYRLWPATPHLPQTAISVDLLHQIAALQLECGTVKLYRKLTNESFEEFKHWQFERETVRKLAPLTSDRTKCPLCPQGCLGFQAGDALRSKPKTQKLDITGVFGMACRHEHPLKFLNLKRGENLEERLKAMEKRHRIVRWSLQHCAAILESLQTKKTHCLLATIHMLVLECSFYCGLIRTYADG
ncbi:hypothetical protein J4Q44_G00082070 [Coregonus suidteri]|uniref:CxC2-like cysteine cluster KDZ transposase-associated domain-containing protein n=1 Tax=Coregonus suidteri TaxID=861788 RepID=A0AAN8R1S3_9TELE